MVGFGSNQPDEVGVIERRNPMHFQAFVRYRTEGVGDDFMGVGIGAGWTFVKTVRRSFEEYTQGPHLFALEALRAMTLTERLTLKVGASLGPLHLHPVVLFAWK